MYSCRRWETAKEELQHYHLRQPERTALYRCVYHGRDRLSVVWEERFQSTYGVLRDEVLKAFDAYLNCGILAHGAARVYCDQCKHTLLVAYSCKKRGVCPSCSAKRAVLFAEHLYEQVITDTPSRHIVFTIPKRLRAYLKYDRSLNSLLFSAAWGGIQEVLGNGHGVPAAVLTVQTAGEALNFHPHLHGCLADGLFATDGSFSPFKFIDQAKLQQRFGDRVVAALVKRELLDDQAVAQLLTQEHSGFNVWLGDRFQDQDSKRFVARYIERGPLSMEKLSVEDDLVTYTTKAGTTHEFDLLEFLALLSTHIAKPYESLTRYYGFWSCRSRGEQKKLRALQTPEITAHFLAEEPQPKPTPNSAWARCIKLIYEVNPLQCPKCKGTMRIIAFIRDPQAIKQIADSLGLAPYQTPPPMAVGPPQVEDFAFGNADFADSDFPPQDS